MKVLIIEDDVILGESLQEYLEMLGHEVTWLDDDRDAVFEFRESSYDFIILDLMLRYSKGEYLLKDFRKVDTTVPIIIITAKDTLSDKEACFGCGADDYIVKPFDPKELVLRMKTIYKRLLSVDVLQIGDVSVNMEKQSIMTDGVEKKVTKKEWDLLVLLLKNRGKLVTFECIMNYVWGDAVVGTESVRTYIRHLRAILPEGVIETYKGRGYMLK